MCCKIVNSVSVQKLGSGGGCWQRCACRAARAEPWVCSPLPSRCWRGSCGPFGRAFGGIWLGGCSSRNTPGAEEVSGLEKDPGIVLILPGEGLAALVVQGTGEVFGHSEASHSSCQQDLPSRPLGMAGKSLQGKGSPRRHPLATATSATRAGTSAALSVPRARRAARARQGKTTPAGPGEPTQPLPGIIGTSVLLALGSAQPRPTPQSRGAQALNLLNLFCKTLLGEGAGGGLKTESKNNS